MATHPLLIDEAQVLIEDLGPADPLTPEEARIRAFACALSDGTLEDVQRMLDEGMDPSGDDEGLPFIASCLYRPKKLRALLEAGANTHVRLQGWINGHLDAEDLTLVEYIICDHWGSDSNSDRDMFLAPRLECLQLLLDHGAPAQVREEIEIPAPMRAYLAQRLAQHLDTSLPEAAPPAPATASTRGRF